jgi:hypothetical protein
MSSLVKRRFALPALLLFPLSACPHAGRVAPESTVPLSDLPQGTARPAEEAIWEALLAGYAAHAFPSEGDMVRMTLAATGSGSGGRAPVVLLARDASDSPYHRAWLESLAARSLVASVCLPTGPGYCPGSEVTTYLRLRDPEFATPDTAVVTVYELGIDPSSCGHGGGFAGSLTVQFRLVRTPAGWIIISREQLQGSSIIC